ncbi:Receptor-type guanylate cyclase gcy [Seminavis robusta]|uniref:Receptor-type guanylate cyclase gcy n=1 Tax=Seminavis robusta TaxID=568900 RepID=A0A9N8E4I3_9STRA|nr:Receptor-type guanylate cyclase gcy [Seminavis robusta]|eukprot:Sro610_g175140.1 Receptor-type guanylate cyclase gcy (1282) ;mRNA; r:24578-29391
MDGDDDELCQDTGTRDIETGSHHTDTGHSTGENDMAEDDSLRFVDEDNFQDEVEASPLKDGNAEKDYFRGHPVQKETRALRLGLILLFLSLAIGTVLVVYCLADALSEHEDVPLHPALIAVLFLAWFGIVGSTSVFYHMKLVRRLCESHKAATDSQAIVSSFFPAQFRERLLQERNQKVGDATTKDATKDATDNNTSSSNNVGGGFSILPKAQLKRFLDNGSGEMQSRGNPMLQSSAPLADLYPNCTVLFADIAGFTSWSSEREPSQVFLLLEGLYSKFDMIAKRMRVFKVETIGDCYLAVTGLPDPQDDHAVRMVKYARFIVQEVVNIVKQLERVLGPDTADLRLRCGLHSGPVTAGILRGERSRFQLFGDTVNTASRMETTGERHRIQMSQSTADLLIQDGKEHWVKLRHDLVSAKGKGQLQTYWFVNARNNHSSDRSTASGSRSSDDHKDAQSIGWGDNEDDFVLSLPPMSRSAKNKRLIDWTVGILSQQLKRVVAQRDPSVAVQAMADPNAYLQKKGETPYEETVEVLELPKFGNASVFADSHSIELGHDIEAQLRSVVTQIANRYKDNAFHNFEHATHVVQSMQKLLNRVVTPEEINYDQDCLDDIENDLHNYTYGLTSDALSQFAIIWSGLVHDVDHAGVSNGQLAEENPELGEKYKNRSIAEAHSVDISWDILMQPENKELQQCIFATETELNRFRSTIVNSVMATDIFEKDAKAKRNQRWEKAFSTDDTIPAAESFQDTNLRATIVIEHIIQASDVSHCMQHWKVYQKWNERLFREMAMAFDEGRLSSDPRDGWYKGELWFYDNYIIPLAKKLAECKVFGVSSDEYLNYAMENRKEWARKGEQVVKDMADRYQKRKELEIGGLTTDEINGFTPQDLEYIMKKLIQKGRNNGTKRVDAEKGQNDAAQAWMDALEIYERAPATSEMRDRSLVFPVYSGVHAWLKFGKIKNDEDGFFEQNLARKFVRESKRFRGTPVHYIRAMALLCEVTAVSGNYPAALKLLETLKSSYDTQEHSLAVEKVYGVDRAAVVIAQSAMWYDQMGDTEMALSVCKHVTTELLPDLDPTNTLGMFELLSPVLKILKQNGLHMECYNLFNEHVHEAFLKNHGPDAFTPTKSLHKPIVWLFAMSHDPDNFEDFDEVVEWLSEGDNGVPNDNLDTIVIRSTWGPTDMAAELCLLVAKRLLKENRDEEICKKIADKGLRLARTADGKIKNKNGRVVLYFANKVHAPVLEELEQLAKTLGIYTEPPERNEPPAGVTVNLPPSYLVTPVDATEFA